MGGCFDGEVVEFAPFAVVGDDEFGVVGEVELEFIDVSRSPIEFVYGACGRERAYLE